MTTPKQYWMTLTERDAPAALRPEFDTHPQADPLARRTFLKAAGFSFAGLAASACRPAPQHALPHIIQPELVPGLGYAYATTCGACEARCGLLVTTRDGRPTKIEGNPDHPLSGGATCAVGQASILGLYDSERLREPMKAGAPATWADVDAAILRKLGEVRQSGMAVRLLTSTVTSPTTTGLIAEFLATCPNARHDVYDPVSVSAVLDAHALTHGARVLPHYHFERADVVVAFDADFLGTWIAPVEFARGYAAKRRVVDGTPAAATRHVHVESRLSLTGSKADQRLAVAPGDIDLVASHLAQRIAQRAGAPVDWRLAAAPVDAATLDVIADRLWTARGHALVVSGSDDVQAQEVCNFINHLLGAYGTTIDVDNPSYQRQGNDTAFGTLRGELDRGEVALLIIAGVNPVYDMGGSETLTAALKKVPLVVSVAERVDETSRLAHFVCPDHHYLESWGDAEPTAGVLSLAQPVIQPLGNTRSFLESLAAWTGTPRTAYDAVRQQWEKTIHPRAAVAEAFPVFWNKTLEAGVVAAPAVAAATPRVYAAASVRPVENTSAPGGAPALVLYRKVGMLDGRHAHNAWLHELPDPVTKVTWDNYASLSPATAAGLGVVDGDVVRVDADGVVIELPAFVQPGQHDSAVAIALGYGRAGTERFNGIGPSWVSARRREGLIGKNAAVFITEEAGRRRYAGRPVKVTRTGGSHPLASTQIHHSLTTPGALAPYSAGPATIIQETTLADAGHHDEAHGPEGDLWPPDHRYPGHRWGMAIDLDSCNGCSACVIACQVENNIPVVGYDEVRRQREMHWLRIDRYYSDEEGDVRVAHQPMLCQHCENAPCETVCPVLATVHSSEGLNEQAYNRCVGTRYCANNCPYKVRRFNWFDYPHDDAMENLVLNPNVTVRSRGVMEKCTFCVQRIEESKATARRAGTSVKDGDVKTACQQTCPAEAIVFGDLNDPKSKVAHLAGSQRAYRVLEELNVKPAVRYLKVVRRDETGGSHA